jgi:hypothetical protein
LWQGTGRRRQLQVGGSPLARLRRENVQVVVPKFLSCSGGP